jgi:hypothetical protein
MEVMLKHVSHSFKLRFGQLVDEGFEFVSGHGGSLANQHDTPPAWPKKAW